MQVAGVHHITAIATEPQRNIDFYVDLLGLRLVKRTVNFDDPGTYHFYFGDEIGTPGTILTFFPWPGAIRGSRGTGQVTAVSFAVAPAALEFWEERLRENRVNVEKTVTRFAEPTIRFEDPDGLLLELVAMKNAAGTRRWAGSSIATDYQIQSLAAPTLEISRLGATERLLTEVLHFDLIGEEKNRRRYAAGERRGSDVVDLVVNNEGFGRIAAGTVHHIAFRVANDEEQLRWREQLISLGFNVSPVMDRYYFHSIYFREPSGILFELATDGPGFATDESVDALGEGLKLPPSYERMRADIEETLPRIELHHVNVK